MREARWHDADDVVRLAVEHDLLTQNALVCSKSARPEVVRKDDHLRPFRLILLLGIPAADLRTDAEHIDERRRRR